MFLSENETCQQFETMMEQRRPPKSYHRAPPQPGISEAAQPMIGLFAVPVIRMLLLYGHAPKQQQ